MFSLNKMQTRSSTHPNGSGAFGVSWEKQGVALAGVPLLRQTGHGFAPRPAGQVQALVSKAYLIEADTAPVMRGLEAVARALNDGNTPRARQEAALLKLPDLDWDGAVRIAQADEALTKYSEDQPRDWHGRWTVEGGSDGSAGTTGQEPEQFALPPNWLHLPHDDKRIDELGDLAEWIANARPEDEPGLRADIKRLFYDVGDGQGGDGISTFLNDALKPGLSTQDRQRILDALDHFTRTDPRDAAHFTNLLNTGIVLGGSVLAELPAAGVAPFIQDTPGVAGGVWRLGWAGRALNVAIPKGSITTIQRAALQAARKRAKRLGIDFIVTPF
jgi:hypothetical protein